MPEEDFLSLVHCLIFATKNHAKQVIETVVKIFVSCEHIQEQHQLDLHLSLKTMIKYHYKDKNEIRRLLTMITKAVSEKPLTQVRDYEYLVQSNKDYEIIVAEKDKQLSEIKAENERLKEELKQNASKH